MATILTSDSLELQLFRRLQDSRMQEIPFQPRKGRKYVKKMSDKPAHFLFEDASYLRREYLMKEKMEFLSLRQPCGHRTAEMEIL
jgi:hypothetical protein